MSGEYHGLETIDKVLRDNDLVRKRVGASALVDIEETSVTSGAISDVTASANPRSPLADNLGVKVFGWQFERVQSAHGHPDAA